MNDPPRQGRRSAAPARLRKQGRVNLARALSKLGLCSRSEAIRLIQAGAVTVGGRTVLDPSFRCTPERDAISILNRPPATREMVYIALNKLPGTVTTRSDERGRTTVYETLGELSRWLFPVGRLDRDSEGLLIFTNDTHFGDLLTSPSSHIEKWYEATLDRPLAAADASIMSAGMTLDGERLRPVRIRGAGTADVELILTEGRNRQIRRMCAALGYRVLRLRRTRIGPVALGDLAPGSWRHLRPDEIAALFAGGRT
ncbi:MAG TPA: pseudouridine synthase [Bacteroidota bacterium]|nr:pseudouridine synthase [Bacteroidota bacterium]